MLFSFSVVNPFSPFPDVQLFWLKEVQNNLVTQFNFTIEKSTPDAGTRSEHRLRDHRPAGRPKNLKAEYTPKPKYTKAELFKIYTKVD